MFKMGSTPLYFCPLVSEKGVQQKTSECLPSVYYTSNFKNIVHSFDSSLLIILLLQITYIVYNGSSSNLYLKKYVIITN